VKSSYARTSAVVITCLVSVVSTFVNGSNRAIKKSETDEKVDRSDPGSMGANEKARPGDKQRSSRSLHGATVLHARQPPRGVRMTRVPEADVKDACRKRREFYSYFTLGLARRP